MSDSEEWSDEEEAGNESDSETHLIVAGDEVIEEDDKPMDVVRYLNEGKEPKYHLRKGYESNNPTDPDEGAIDVDKVNITCVTSTLLRYMNGEGSTFSYCFRRRGKFKNNKYDGDNRIMLDMKMIPVLLSSTSLLVCISRAQVFKFRAIIQARSHTVLALVSNVVCRNDCQPPFSKRGSSKTGSLNNSILYNALEAVGPFMILTHGGKYAGRTEEELMTRKTLMNLIYQNYQENLICLERLKYADLPDDAAEEEERVMVVYSLDGESYVIPFWGIDIGSEYLEENVGDRMGYVQVEKIRGIKLQILDLVSCGGEVPAGTVKC